MSLKSVFFGHLCPEQDPADSLEVFKIHIIGQGLFIDACDLSPAEYFMADGISHCEPGPGQELPAGIGADDITAADHGQQLRVNILQERGLPCGLVHGIGLVT